MTVDELKDLHTKGFEIASHTKSHPKLPSLDDVKLIEELQGSKKDLEDRVGITVKTLAYPYYAYDDRVMKAVQDAGYLGARAGWGSFKNGSDRLFEMVSQESVNNPNPFASTRVAE
jgi:peptidoglycan/xylan/chitin deacetylase (PgdA/CDA1 family)